MAEWTKDELTKIASADDLHISPFCDVWLSDTDLVCSG